MILTVKDKAKRYQVSTASINRYTKQGLLPAGFLLGGSRRWNSEQLDEFDKQQSSNKKGKSKFNGGI